MSIVRKALKGIGWIAGVTLVLAVTAYTILFLANFRDQPPSVATVSIVQAHEARGSIPDASNSYLTMLGFAGPPEVEPFNLGVKRRDWMLEARPDFDSTEDPLADEYSFRSLRSDAVAELAESCSDPDMKCLESLEQYPDVVSEWLREEDWLLIRYRALIRTTEFEETVPFDALAPLPPYNEIIDGQRLLFTHAWTMAGNGDTENVRNALDEDLLYWRVVLRNSDALITKMIATAAIIKHFKMGNLVLRRLPGQLAKDAVPDSWRRPLDQDERSMKRSFAGEWAYFDEANRTIVADSSNPFGKWLDSSRDTALDRSIWILMKPFWQPQDLVNRHAQMMIDLGELFDAPIEAIPSAVERADNIQEAAFRPFERLYNFTGDILMSVGHSWTFSSYAVRVSDLEGIRRAALLATELRAAGVSKNEVVQSLLASDTVDPYTNDPFAWHDDSESIAFRGLEPHDRATHEIVY